MNDEYKITPLGVLALIMPVELAKKAMEMLESRATRYEGNGVPAIIFNGRGGTFVKVETTDP